MKGFGEFLFVLFIGCIISQPSYSNILTPKFPNDGQITKDNNAYIDKNVDYTKFMGLSLIHI